MESSSSDDFHGEINGAEVLHPLTAAAQRASRPTPKPVALLSSKQTLARESPQTERLAIVQAAESPLLEAAQPLLRALADMPGELEAAHVDAFHRLLLREVSTFQSMCNDARVRHEYIIGASYALCTAIDEAASRTNWGGSKDAGTGAGEWASRQLAVHFHGDSQGGEKVFLLIGRLVVTPHENLDLLELMLFVLGLGFEGHYRHSPHGRREMENTRHRLHNLVAAGRGEVPRKLSPHWRGVGAARRKKQYRVPVWFTVVTLTLTLLGLFAWCKYQLVRVSTDVESRVRAIGAMHPPPLPAAKKTLRLKELLAAEITRGSVSVEEDNSRSAISFQGDDMFVAGHARLNTTMLPTVIRVANEINTVSGAVHITGHSDDRPIKTREFPSNQALSENRAASIADVFKRSGVAPDRMHVEGKGDALPLADNATPAGRARNRRVDIVVSYDESPLSLSH